MEGCYYPHTPLRRAGDDTGQDGSEAMDRRPHTTQSTRHTGADRLWNAPWLGAPVRSSRDERAIDDLSRRARQASGQSADDTDAESEALADRPRADH